MPSCEEQVLYWLSVIKGAEPKVTHSLMVTLPISPCYVTITVDSKNMCKEILNIHDKFLRQLLSYRFQAKRVHAHVAGNL